MIFEQRCQSQSQSATRYHKGPKIHSIDQELCQVKVDYCQVERKYSTRQVESHVEQVGQGVSLVRQSANELILPVEFVSFDDKDRDKFSDCRQADHSDVYFEQHCHY